MTIDPRDLKNRFAYHAPKDDNTKKMHREVRAQLYLVADTLDALIPDGREKSIVFTKLEEAMMWANAAIARVNPITEEPR